MTRPRATAALSDAAIVAAIKALVSALVLASGFRALSDDDFARVVIAQRFAEAPSFDPSGTSWLPFPFWLNGLALAVFGSSIEVARAVAFVSGLGSMLLVWLGLRWLGASRAATLGGALIASVFPYSAWLGVATVPELFAAALSFVALASLSQPGKRRVLGALAVVAACLSRYEAWPVAAVFALVALRRRAFAPAALALVGPAAWLANGALRHGDALFFVGRVSEYRRAIGLGNQDAWHALGGYPSLLARAEPELVVFAAAAVTAALALGASDVLRRHAVVLAGLVALLLFLIAGDLRDGAPTHHGERALAAVWIGLAALGADAFGTAWSRAAGGARAALIAVPGLALAPMAGIVRPWYAARDSFVDRSAELEIGRQARALGPSAGRLLIDSPDFGFYAVIAGFGAPSRAAPFDDRDPRKPRSPSPFGSSEALAARLRESRADFFVVRSEHLAVAERVGKLDGRAGNFLLLRAPGP